MLTDLSRVTSSFRHYVKIGHRCREVLIILLSFLSGMLVMSAWKSESVELHSSLHNNISMTRTTPPKVYDQDPHMPAALDAATMGEKISTSEFTQFARLSSCVTHVKRLIVHHEFGLFYTPEAAQQTTETVHELPFCSPTSRSTLKWKVAVARPEHSGVCDDPQTLKARRPAIIGVLERPQHAMQFLFSLVGLFALQKKYNLTVENSVSYLTIISYGKFQNWSDVGDVERYPHMQLAHVLTPSRVIYFREPKIRGTLPALSDAERRQFSLFPQSAECIPEAYVGAVVLRMATRRNVHQIEPHHFTYVRERLAVFYNLTLEMDIERRLVILVQRTKHGRRLIENQAVLLTELHKVGFTNIIQVDWEGMPLRDQLQLALNAHLIIGMHGNGHAWNCFMAPGSYMLELSSDILQGNEVKEGLNYRNAGNLAGLCPIQSLSLRFRAIPKNFSATVSTHHRWKEVDIMIEEGRNLELVKKFFNESANRMFEKRSN